MRGMKVRIYKSLTPQWDGETGVITQTRLTNWAGSDDPCTVATVKLDGIYLSAEFALCELSEL